MKRIRKTEIPQSIIDLGNRINEVIKQNDFKQKDVAYDAGLDVENLRKYIKGKQEMKVGTMLKIAFALNMEASELIKDLKISK
nr:helix-turn-helix transcriptional regulator [uncultured Flavobacterium sp.]